MLVENPSDPVLRHLRFLTDNGYLSRSLESYWGSLQLPAGTRLEGLTTSMVKFAPHRRATLRHELHLSDRRVVVIYSKTFGDEVRSASVFENIQILWQTGSLRDGGFVIPRPLFYLEELNTIFLQGLEGGNAHEYLHEFD